MKKLFILLFVFSSNAAIAEKCPLSQLEEFEYLDIHCQFYLGTQGFRNELYSVAASHWKEIVDKSVKYEGEKELKAMAISNLGFLTYNGYGIEKDKEHSVNLWKKAVSLDGLEARRHLGAAFSDEEFSKFNLIQALGWYESVFLVLESENEITEENMPIYERTKLSANKLKLLLNERQQKLAKDFALSTINK